MRIRSIVAAAGLGAALLAGCGAGTEPPADDPPAPAGDTPDGSGGPTDAGAPMDSGTPAETGDAVPAEPCPVGTWRLSDLASTGQDGQPVFSGGGSLVVMLTADNRWTVEDDGSQPLQATVEVSGVEVTGTAIVQGSAEGRYAGQGGPSFVFEDESASGRVTLTAPGYEETLPMESVLTAIVPTGAARVICEGSTMTIEGDHGRWTFAAVTEAGGGTTPDPGVAAAPAPAIFDEDGTTGSFACGGQDITVNAADVSSSCPATAARSPSTATTPRSRWPRRRPSSSTATTAT